MIDSEALEEEVLQWIRNSSEDALAHGIGPETELLGLGLIDSVGMMGLIAYLEDRFDVLFDFDTFDPTTSSSVRALVQHCMNS